MRTLTCQVCTDSLLLTPASLPRLYFSSSVAHMKAFLVRSGHPKISICRHQHPEANPVLISGLGAAAAAGI